MSAREAVDGEFRNRQPAGKPRHFAPVTGDGEMQWETGEQQVQRLGVITLCGEDTPQPTQQ